MSVNAPFVWQRAAVIASERNVSVASVLVRLTDAYRLSGVSPYFVVCSSHKKLYRSCGYCCATRRYWASMEMDRNSHVPHLPQEALLDKLNW